jgi:hypothetical protein
MCNNSRMKKLIALFAVAALFFAVSPASALQWEELGAQQMAMGGAGVADAQGPLAQYWNPAALGHASENAYGLAIPVDVEAQLKGSVIQGAKDLSSTYGNIQNGSCTGATCQQKITQALNELNQPGEGLQVNAAGGANLKIGKFTVFLNEFVAAGAHPYIDQNPAHQTVAGLPQNDSQLIVQGVLLSELGLGFGHELPDLPGLYLGGDVKVMRARVGNSDYTIIGNTSFNPNDIAKNLKNTTQDSSNVGVDLGALWDVDRTFDGVLWRPRLGITGRDLNNPKFDTPDNPLLGPAGRYAVNPQVRSGLSFSPANWWHFAGDVDLTKNNTDIDAQRSQYVGAGTEIDVFNRTWINIPLRVGIKHNMADPTNGATFTAGTGLNFLHFMVDVSGEYSNQKIQTQSEDGNKTFPSQVGAAVQLSLLFGGSDERRRHRADAAQSQQELDNQSNH